MRFKNLIFIFASVFGLGYEEGMCIFYSIGYKTYRPCEACDILYLREIIIKNFEHTVNDQNKITGLEHFFQFFFKFKRSRKNDPIFRIFLDIFFPIVGLIWLADNESFYEFHRKAGCSNCSIGKVPEATNRINITKILSGVSFNTIFPCQKEREIQIERTVKTVCAKLSVW